MHRDKLLLLLRSCACVAGMIVLLILGFLLLESWPMLDRVGISRFFSDASWHPSAEPPTFDLQAMLAATLLVTLLSVLIATPWASPPRSSVIFMRRLFWPRATGD